MGKGAFAPRPSGSGRTWGRFCLLPRAESLAEPSPGQGIGCRISCPRPTPGRSAARPARCKNRAGRAAVALPALHSCPLVCRSRGPGCPRRPVDRGRVASPPPRAAAGSASQLSPTGGQGLGECGRGRSLPEGPLPLEPPNAERSQSGGRCIFPGAHPRSRFRGCLCRPGRNLRPDA